MPSGVTPTEQSVRFRVGDMPPLAEGFSDRPDTGRAILDALVPGSTIALVPGSEFAEGKQNWLGASGKTQIAVMLAETLWRSGAVDVVVWISATSRSAVLSGYVEAWTAATGIEPTGTAESVAARFVSWLAETDQPWLVVLDDLPNVDELDGIWPEGPAGRLLITSTQSTVAASRHRTRVFPVGFFSVREALGCLTERLSVNPAQRQGAIDLIEALGREPLALAQAAAVIANSTLACRDYRDYFVRRRQQIGVAAGEVPSAASVTWTLSLGQAEMLLPGQSVRPMLVLIAMLDGHGIPGTVFNTQSASVYLGGIRGRVRHARGHQARLGRAARYRAGRSDQHQPGRAGADDPDEPGGRRRRSGWPLPWPCVTGPPGRRQARCWKRGRRTSREPWTAAVLRANAASLQAVATDILWAEGCHPLLLRAGRSLDRARLAGPAVEYWRELSVHCDNKLPPGHPDALVVAAQLAGAYLAAGYGAEAVTWYQRVLAERSVDLAPGHPAVIAARVSLAERADRRGRARGRGDRPAPGGGRIRAVPRPGPPGHPRGQGRARARAYEASGDVPAAIRLLTQALSERERLQGARDVLTMTTRDRLAAALLAGGKTKQAISGYKRVLADRAAVLGPTTRTPSRPRPAWPAPTTPRARCPRRCSSSEQACADSERVLGADHADTLARRAQLAHLYYAVGRVGDARDAAPGHARALRAGPALR